MSSAVTVSQLQYKLELVEASRRRYQKATIAGSQRGEAMLQTTAQLSDAEDQLARLQAEHQEALHRTEQELRNLRDRCAVLEAEQQADIDACVTSRAASCSDTPQARRAYLAGKTEGQRETIAAHSKIEYLTRELQAAEKVSLSANIQLMELKGKYHATLQDKVKLQRQLRTLQDKLHEIHLQQVETLSSVITNTTRADQMNRRVWESLDKALNTKQSTSKSSSAEVAMLTAENEKLRDALISSMHGTSGATQFPSAAAGTHVGPHGTAVPNGGQFSGQPNSAPDLLGPVHHEAEAQRSRADSMASCDTSHHLENGSTSTSLEPSTPPQTSVTLPSNDQQVPKTEDALAVPVPSSRRMPKSVSFNDSGQQPVTDNVIFDTLASVLQSHTGIQIPQHQETQVHGDSEQQCSQGGGSQGSSVCDSSGSESSEWSGDELMHSLVKERTNRESAGSSVYVQSLSGMLGEEQDAARESRDVEDDELHIDDRVLTTGQRFSKSAIKSVTRKDSVELSRKRLAQRFKAPVNAHAAVCYLQKLVREKDKSERVSFGEMTEGDGEISGNVVALTTEAEPVAGLKQDESAQGVPNSAPPAKTPGPGLRAGLWAALKQKGDGNAAAGVAAALDGFSQEDCDNSVPAIETGNQVLDSSAGGRPASSAPASRNAPARDQVEPRVPVNAAPPAAAHPSGRLSGHASPVQSLSSTGSGLYGSRAPSPEAGRSWSPVGKPPSRMPVHVSPAHVAMQALESMSPDQDSQIADLEEQTAGVPSYTHPLASSFPTGAQRAAYMPARPLWEQGAWEGPVEDAARQCAKQILLQTPLIAASQGLALSAGRLNVVSSPQMSPGALDHSMWKSETAGLHCSGSRAKQAGEQYAAAVMQSSPVCRVPRAVTQGVPRMPSARYALQ